MENTKFSVLIFLKIYLKKLNSFSVFFMTVEVFIKVPEKVEVLQYDGTNYDEVIKFAGEKFCKIKGCLAKGDYIVKHGDYNIISTIYKPNFAKQDLIGTYNKDVVQGVNPNVHMSLEKLQEYFEVPIVSCKEQGRHDNDMAPTKTKGDCGVKKYQKKPIIVEAVRNTGDNYSDIMEFTDGECKGIYSSNSKGYVFLVETLEGVMVANVGDYIIKGVKGEFYPCKPDVFEATYDVCK